MVGIIIEMRYREECYQELFLLVSLPIELSFIFIADDKSNIFRTVQSYIC